MPIAKGQFLPKKTKKVKLSGRSKIKCIFFSEDIVNEHHLNHRFSRDFMKLLDHIIQSQNKFTQTCMTMREVE